MTSRQFNRLRGVIRAAREEETWRAIRLGFTPLEWGAAVAANTGPYRVRSSVFTPLNLPHAAINARGVGLKVRVEKNPRGLYAQIGNPWEGLE